MVDIYKIVEFIKELDSLAFKVNNLFNQHYNLRSNNELVDYDAFEYPILASKRGIVSPKGIFQNERNESIEYFFHGTGVSYQYEDRLIGFEYYPITKPKRRPVFGIMQLFSFIESSGTTLSLDDKLEVENELKRLEVDGTITFCYQGFNQYYLNE